MRFKRWKNPKRDLRGGGQRWDNYEQNGKGIHKTRDTAITIPPLILT